MQARYAPKIVDLLKTAGAAAEGLHLPDHGVRGNEHGLIYEKNSDEALALVLRWLAAHTNTQPQPHDCSLSRRSERQLTVAT